MPLPFFQRSPRPSSPAELPAVAASPASSTTSRFTSLHQNVRSMIAGSSVYNTRPSSPVPSTTNTTPKIPFLGFLRRPQTPPDPIHVPGNEDVDDGPRDSSDSRSPLRPQHTAGTYTRAIAPLNPYPQRPEVVHDRHPADVPLDYGGSVDPETRELQEEVHGRRRHRRHGRRKHRATHWVRRRGDRGKCFGFVKTPAARRKCVGCLISGLFLLTVLTIYLTLALTNKSLGQEVHVLFILIILATTIFFCHSIIRLCLIALHPELHAESHRPRIPDMTGPEGFHPIRPIRVHLARDEELGEVEPDDTASEDTTEKPKVAMPPPAYGLWRSSVRVDPNLLHWQRVEASASTPPRASRSPSPPNSNSRNGSTTSLRLANGAQAEEQQGPRPPSYVSEDGVSYVVEAAPRSTAPGPQNSGASDIHPAWRPGFAVSEIHVGGWEGPHRV